MINAGIEQISSKIFEIIKDRVYCLFLMQVTVPKKFIRNTAIRHNNCRQNDASTRGPIDVEWKTVSIRTSTIMRLTRSAYFK
jgi:hypothetical protein